MWGDVMRISTTDLQNSFGKYLALVEQEDIIITKNGKSVAKLVHYREPDGFLVHEESGRYMTTRRVSYEEYMELVESSDQRYELIDGEIYLMASPSFNHQVAVNEIAGHFFNYFKGKSCVSLTAPLDVKLFGLAVKFEDYPNVVQPDIVVICDPEKVNEQGRYEGVPTLVVEVLSPSTRGKDMIKKLNLYMTSGVSEYWIIDLDSGLLLQYPFTEDRTIDNVKSFTAGDTINSSAFEELNVPLANVFD